jgi:predicted RNA binding protein with dsRBD fold (UPF0201 family)
LKIETFPHSIEIRVEVPLQHSEDRKKVEQAVENLFQKIEISSNPDDSKKLVGKTTSVGNLFVIYEKIRARRTLGVVRRLLVAHASTDSTWLFFNKQAAYANIVAVCEELNESPLGPIKMMVICERLDEFINWFVSSRSQPCP